MTYKPLSNETILETAYGVFGRAYHLIFVAEAIVPAGSGTRHQKACYAVAYTVNGTRSGRAFKTYDEAKHYLDTYTTPIGAISA